MPTLRNILGFRRARRACRIVGLALALLFLISFPLLTPRIVVKFHPSAQVRMWCENARVQSDWFGCTWYGSYTHNGTETFSGAVIAPAIGPSATQQHTLPVVASDTIALLAASQTLTGKTYNAQGTGNVFQIGGTTITNTGQSGTTFLRGDGTWAAAGGGVSEATWSTAQFSFASAIIQAQTILPNAHTLERFTIFVQLTLGSCTTSPVLAFKDITSNTVLSSFTVPNAQAFTDSGALSVAMTAGDTFGFVTTTAGVGCTGGSNATITAVFK